MNAFFLLVALAASASTFEQRSLEDARVDLVGEIRGWMSQNPRRFGEYVALERDALRARSEFRLRVLRARLDEMSRSESAALRAQAAYHGALARIRIRESSPLQGPAPAPAAPAAIPTPRSAPVSKPTTPGERPAVGARGYEGLIARLSARGIDPEIVRIGIEEARAQGQDPLLVLATMMRESRFKPHVVGKAGEVGLMQIHPQAAQYWKVSLQALYDPRVNARTGSRHLAFMFARFSPRGGADVSARLEDNDVQLALAGYAAGHGAVQRAGGVPRGAVPDIRKAIANYRWLQAQL